jgi:hypothetical protein
MSPLSRALVYALLLNLLHHSLSFTAGSHGGYFGGKSRTVLFADNEKTGKKKPTAYDAIVGAPTLAGPSTFIITSQQQQQQLEDEISFTVYGEPVPLSRHRTAMGGLRTYNPSATAQKHFAQACIASRVLPQEPFEGPLEATLTFYFSRPLSHYGSGKNTGVLKSKDPPPPTPTPLFTHSQVINVFPL